MPKSSNQEIVTLNVRINGKTIESEIQIFEIRVTKALNQIASAEIKLFDGDATSEAFSISESNEFLPGGVIEIEAGYNHQTVIIFKGLVVSQRIQVSEEDGPRLVIGCRDEALKMTTERKTGAFERLTDSDVMKNLAQRNGISAQVASTKQKHEQLVQFCATDWDFLVSRAEVNGMVVISSDNKLVVRPPDSKDSPKRAFTFGENLLEVDTKLDATNQLDSVKAHAWDPRSQGLVSASAAKPSVPDQGNVTGDKRSGVASKQTNLASTANLESGALEAWANAQLLKSRLSKIRGVFKVFGEPDLAPNQTIELKGLGKRFNGNAYVSSIEHRFEDGNWWTLITTGMDPEWHAEKVKPTCEPASGLLPGIHGLQNAIVKAVSEDPEGETRIRVSLETLTVDGTRGDLWARWTQPYASKGAGMFFMPEIGDEVVLGFLNDDPRFPVVLGSLYSSKNNPPMNANEGNSKKAVVSRQKLTIELDDDQKALRIFTPGGNEIMLNDKAKRITIKDQNDNKIEMTEDGISVKSSKELSLEAAGSLSIKSDGAIITNAESTELISNAEFSVKAFRAKISADTTLDLKGGTEINLSPSGDR